MLTKIVTKVFLFICVGVFIASAAKASVVLQLSDQQMTVRADRIVRAKVIRKISRWEKKTRRIYTYIKLIVLDPIKGAKNSQELTIRLMGGTANGMGMYVPGSPSFQLGEEVLVFLEKIRQAPKFHHVMAMAYGKFQVTTDAKTQTQMLVRQLKGVSLARKTTSGRMSIKHGHELVVKPIKLNSFVNRLRAYLRVDKLKKATPKVLVPKPRLVRPIRPHIVPRSIPQPTQPVPKR